jgi:hypothetical protein
MNILKVFLLAMFLALPAAAAERQATKQVIAKQPANAAAEVARHWSPTPFPEASDSLPPGYDGIEPKQFLALFMSKVAGIEKKNEYETSTEYERRISNKDAILNPITTSDLYAFKIDQLIYAYNADSKTYNLQPNSYGNHFEINSRYSSIFDNSTSDWFLVEASTLDSQQSQYSASNALGGQFIVTKTENIEFALAIRKSSAVFNNSLWSKPSWMDDTKVNDYHTLQKLVIPVSIEKARTLGPSSNICVLFVGRILDAKLITTQLRYEPKLKRLTDTIHNAFAIPFDLKKIVVYSKTTGEVLSTTVFR